MHISTVRIRSVETASGFIVINEADFDPSKHQFWNWKSRPPRRSPPPPSRTQTSLLT